MPRYVISRQYLVPIYEHICIEAPSLEDACRQAVDDADQPWGDDAQIDFDTARATTIAEAVEIPHDIFPELRSTEDGDRHMLSHVLYDAGLPLLSIPDEFADDRREGAAPPGFT
jgi:hypothetical protein